MNQELPNHRPVSLTDIASTAQSIRQKTQLPATLSEVSAVLGVRPDLICSVVNNARRKRNIPWQVLDITVGLHTEERQSLAELLKTHAGKDEQLQTIRQVLTLFHERKISRLAVGALVYAVLCKTYTYDQLDRPFAKLVKADPHVVSGTLHDVRRARRTRLGLLEKMDRIIKQNLEQETETSSDTQRYRKFAKDFIRLKALQVEANMFGELLLEQPVPNQLIDQIRQIIEAYKGSRLAKEHQLHPNQLRILNELIKLKSQVLYTNLKAVASDLDINHTTLWAALKGRKNSLGAINRLLISLNHHSTEDQFAIYEAGAKLIDSDCLSICPQEQQTLERAIHAHQRLCSAPSTLQLDLAEMLLEGKAQGKKYTVSELAQSMGLTESPVRFALYGRDGKLGLIDLFNQRLLGMDPTIRRSIIADLVPEQLQEHSQICLSLSKIKTLDEQTSTIKQMLLNTLEVILLEQPQLPKLTAREEKQGKKTERALQNYEQVKLVMAYITGQEPNIQSLARTAGSIIGLPYNLTIAEKSLARFMFGYIEQASHSFGAISRLRDSNSSPEKNSKKPFLEHAIDHCCAEIMQAETTELALKIVNRYCTTERSQLSRICLAAIDSISDSDSVLVRQFLSSLSTASSGQDLDITNRQAIAVVTKTYSIIYATLIKRLPHRRQSLEPPTAVMSLLRGAQALHVAPQKLAHFFVGLYQQWLTNSLDEGILLVYELAKLAKVAGQKNSDLGQVARYVRRIYSRFLEMEFSTIPLHELSVTERYDFSLIISRMTEKVKVQNAQKSLIDSRVTGFFKNYSIATVLRTYGSHHIQSSNNPDGVAFEELELCGLEAVYRAAEKYDPDKIKPGKIIASFDTYAIVCIRRAVSNCARSVYNDRKKSGRSIYTGLTSEEGGADNYTLANLIEAPDPEATELTGKSAIQMETLARKLSQLAIVERRVIQLRYDLERTAGVVKEKTGWERIAQALFDEKLTPKILSISRVKMIYSQALVNLRVLTLADSVNTWPDYITDIGNRDIPNSIICQVAESTATVMTGLELKALNLKGVSTCIVEIEKVLTNSADEHELILKVHDAYYKHSGGKYLVTVKSGVVMDCDKIE